MLSRRLVLILAGLILILGVGGIFYWSMPSLADYAPAADAQNVPASADLRLVFSRTMQPDSVLDRLEITPAYRGSYRWEGETLTFTPDRPWPSGETIQVRLSPGARTNSLLSLAIREETSWTFTIGHPRLLYLYPAEGPSNIFMLNPVSGESQQLTFSRAGISEFDANTNGTAIYYSANNETGGSNIYRMDLSGGDSGQVAPAGGNPGASQLFLACSQALCRVPQISPEEDFLAYERTALLGSNKRSGSSQPTYPQVWLLPLHLLMPLAVNADPGSETMPLSEEDAVLAGDPGHQTLQPDWSSQGLLAFYDTNSSAYIILNPQTGERDRFPNQTGQAGSWHPDGTDFVAPEISFIDAGDPEVTGLDPLANSHLLQYQLTGETTVDLTVAENLEDTSPVYSPDGVYLALARKFLDVSRWTPGRQIWLMRPDGSDAHPLTNDPYFNHYQFAWSPSNDQLAFVRFNQTVLTEPPELWVIDPVSTRANRLVVGGYSPQWIP